MSTVEDAVDESPDVGVAAEQGDAPDAVDGAARDRGGMGKPVTFTVVLWAGLTFVWAVVGVGGHTGWFAAVTAYLAVAAAVGFLYLPARPSRTLLASTVGVALILGWVAAGFRPVPEYELNYDAPAVPQAWSATGDRVDMDAWSDVPIRKEGRAVAFEVTDKPEEEAEAYVKALRADGWETVEHDTYRAQCDLTTARFDIVGKPNTCTIATYGTVDAPWTHLTNGERTVTVEPRLPDLVLVGVYPGPVATR